MLSGYGLSLANFGPFGGSPAPDWALGSSSLLSRASNASIVSTTITLAGRAAILIVSEIGAGEGAQIGIALRTRSSMAKKVVRRGVFPASSGGSSPVPKDAKRQFAPNLQHSDTENTNR